MSRIPAAFPGVGLLVLLAGLPLSARNPAQEPVPEPVTLRLEAHLLRWPTFDKPFDEALALWLGPGDWRDLDQRWSLRQKENVRYQVLRGMLAERQGDFATAATHYLASSEADEWGRYHRARLLAFTGDVATARDELDQLARTTDHPHVFTLAAEAVGELVLLQEGTEAAEAFFSGLWDIRPQFPLRLALVEPLLTLKTELGTGSAWLRSLLPPLPDNAPDPADNEAANRLLWWQGDSLTRVSWSSFRTRNADPSRPPHMGTRPPSLDSPPMVGRINLIPPWLPHVLGKERAARWYPECLPYFGFLRISDPEEAIQALALREIPCDTSLDRLLSTGCGREVVQPTPAFTPVHSDTMLSRASLLRDRLREKPWLISPIILTLPDAESAQQVHDALARNIFADVVHPSWQLCSLLLRLQAGETPDQLRDDALRLWHDAIPGDRLILFDDCPDGTNLPRARLEGSNLRGFRGSVLSQRASPGVTDPSTEVVWNLRGQAFVVAMAARYSIGLHTRQFSGGSVATLSSSLQPPVLTPGWSRQRTLFTLSRADSGHAIRKALWRLREHLDLSDARLGDSGPGDPVSRTVLALARGDTDLLFSHASNGTDLTKLRGFWLRELKAAVRNQHPRDPLDEAFLAARQGALASLDRIWATRHSDWILPSVFPEPEEAPFPPVSPAQLREILAHYRTYLGLLTYDQRSEKGRNELEARWKEVWSQFEPRLADPASAPIALLEAEAALERDSLPHALWGLEWAPSLPRTTLILSGYQDFVREEPPFLTTVLPELAKSPPGGIQNPAAKDAAFLLNASSRKLVHAYGHTALQPQSTREAEIRPFVSRHPLAGDLLAIWEAVGRTSPPPDSETGLSSVQLQDVLAALEASSTRRAQMTRAVLHRNYGDLELARRLAKELADSDGPENGLAPALTTFDAPGRLSAPITSVPPTSLSPPLGSGPSQEETALTAVRRALANPSYRESPASVVRRLTPTPETKRHVFDWLKTETKEDPAFGPHAAILAELARTLDLPPEQITEAEALERKLSQNDPDFWLREATELARRDADALIEAILRTDFSRTLDGSLWSRQDKALERVIAADRTGELADAFASALRRSQRGHAWYSTTPVLRIVWKGILEHRDRTERETWAKAVLGAVLQHQRQLIFLDYSFFSAQPMELETNGHQSLATITARAALRGVWPLEGAEPSPPEKRGIPNGFQTALNDWTSNSSGTPNPDARILPLFELALRGEGSDDFVRDLVADARSHPTQEPVISNAVVALAMVAPLPPDVATLWQKLEPVPAMRVAWRLCETAPAEHVRLPELVPALETGLAAMFQEGTGFGDLWRDYRTVVRLTPWLERAGATESLARLLPGFVAGVSHSLDPKTRKHLALLAYRLGDREALSALSSKWEEDCLSQLETPTRVDWTEQTIAALAGVATEISDGGSFAALAHEVWSRFTTKYAATTDLSASSTAALADALLVSGEAGRIQALIPVVERLTRFGGDPAFHPVLQRLRLGAALLAGDESRLPVALAWAAEKTPGDATSASLHWRLTLGEDAAASSPARSIRSPLQVPPVLHALGETYDLELFTGDSPESMRPVARVALAAATGAIEVPDLPPSGWVKAVLRGPASGALSTGPAAIYCLGPILADTSRSDGAGRGNDPPHRGIRGGMIPVQSGTKLCLSLPATLSTEGAPLSRNQFSLLALDEEQRPLHSWALSDLLASASPSADPPDGIHRLVVEIPAPHPTAGRRIHPSGEGGGSAFAAIFCPGEESENGPAVQVRLFSPPPPVAPEHVPLVTLEPQVVAETGFEYQSWHVHATLPRAAFLTDRRLAVFDTSVMPWKPIFSIESPDIKRSDRPFLIREDSLILLQWAADREQRAAFRRIEWTEGNIPSLADCPVTHLPYDPAPGADGFTLDLVSTEFPPGEDGALLLAGGRSGILRAIWLDPNGGMTSTQLKRPFPVGGTPSHPVVAWWGGDGQFTVHEMGLLHHFQRSADEIRFLRTEPGKLSPEAMPEGAVAGRSLRYREWSLRQPNLLVKLDPVSGTLLDGFHLPEECKGIPIWLGNGSEDVYLLNRRNQIVRVTPPVP